MTPADLKALREELRCTARELGAAIGLDQETILDWEREASFPTKRFIDRMEALRKLGPDAIPRKKRGAKTSPHAVLADPEMWTLFRKLVAHTELRRAVAKLAEGYADPADEPGR